MMRCWKVIDVNQESNGLRAEPLWYPSLGVDLAGEEAVYVDLYESANQKVREPTCHCSGEI